MDKLKIKLEDILLEAGVQIIYSFRPIDISKDSDYIKVAIVVKGGRKIIHCKDFIEGREDIGTEYILETTF